MSFSSLFTLISFSIFYFYVRSCNARSFGMVNEIAPAHSHVSSRVQTEYASIRGLTKNRITDENTHNNNEDKTATVDQQPRETASTTANEGEEAPISKHPRPAASVSWRIPNSKTTQNYLLGFHSDYSRPKTRSPSHN